MSAIHDPDTAYRIVYAELTGKGVDDHSAQRAAQRAYNTVMTGGKFRLKDYVK